MCSGAITNCRRWQWQGRQSKDESVSGLETKNEWGKAVVEEQGCSVPGCLDNHKRGWATRGLNNFTCRGGVHRDITAAVIFLLTRQDRHITKLFANAIPKVL